MNVDVIIPSKTNSTLAPIARHCVESLRASEPADEVAWNVVVVETEWDTHPFHMGQDLTLFWPQDKPFNYNGALNLGIKATRAEWVVLTNNDVIFHAGWFREILRLHASDPSLARFRPCGMICHLAIRD